MYLASPVSGRTLQVYRAAGAWTEAQANWNNARNHVGPAAEVPVRLHRRLASVGGAASGPGQLRRAEHRAAGAGHRTESAGASPEQDFHSREAANRPVLVLTFGQPPDTVAPETVIDSGPTAETVGTDATVAFSATEPGATFGCSLDGAAFAACPRRSRSPGSLSDRTPSQCAKPTPQATWTRRPQPCRGRSPGRPRRSASDPTPHADPDAEPTPTPTPTPTPREPAPTPTPDTGPDPDPDPDPDGPTPIPAPPSCSATTVTVGADQDSWIQEKDPQKNYGTDSTLKVTTKSGENTRALVRFAPGHPRRLRGHRRPAASSTPLRSPATRCRRSYSVAREPQQGVTWANQPTTSGPAVTAVTPSAAGWMTWNVTASASAMLSGGSNHGFLIRAATENGNGDGQAFNSREKGSDNPPQLVITYGPAS